MCAYINQFHEQAEVQKSLKKKEILLKSWFYNYRCTPTTLAGILNEPALISKA